jgi:hypothetical protein
MSAESIRTPTWFALFWVEPTADQASKTGTIAIAGAPPRLQATLARPLPSGVRMVSDPRGLVFQTSPQFFAHALVEADFTPPPAPAAPAGPITLNVVSLDGRFHPRVVNVTPPTAPAVTGATPIYAPLWSSLRGTSVGEAGALVVNLQWSLPAGAPAGTLPQPGSWAVVTLACTRNGVSYGFAGQADVNGDVIVPLSGLPPPPLSSGAPTPDTMTLTARAPLPPKIGAPPVPDTDAVVKQAPAGVSISAGSAAVASLSLPITWGQFNRISSVTLTPA